MMGHLKWQLRSVLHSAQIIRYPNSATAAILAHGSSFRDRGMTLASQHQELILRRVLAATKEIKTIVAVVSRIDTRLHTTTTKQENLVEKSRLFIDATVKFVALCQRIAKGQCERLLRLSSA